MRIIAGKLKGRKLLSFKADHIRPTTDRVKESLFNILSGYFDEARVLDLYSGTGNLSFESYSRGADFIQCVEKHPKSIEIINKNIDHLDLESSVKVSKLDVFKFLNLKHKDPFDVILIDPPFTLKLADRTMEHLSKTSLFANSTKIAIESSRHEIINDKYDQIVLEKRRDFGDKVLSIFSVLDQ